MHKIITTAVVLLFFLVSCSSEPHIEVPEEIANLENVALFPGEAAPVYDISLERVARFGDTGDLFIDTPAGVAVDDDGNLYLADGSEGKIYVYNPDGSYRYSIGEKGEGPGEFTRVYQPVIREDRLFAMDMQRQKVSEFEIADGSHVRDISLGDGQSGLDGFPNAFIPLSGNRFFVLFSRMEQNEEHYLRYLVPKILDHDGEVLRENMAEFEPGKMLMIQGDNFIQIMSPPFGRQPYVELDQNENIIWGFSDRLHLKALNLEGEYLYSIYHDRENPPMVWDSVLGRYEDETVREAIRKEEAPDTMPSFSGFQIDDENRIWVSLVTDVSDELEWWVLSENGEKLASFTRPESDEIQLVKDGMVYIQEEDETGLREIVKYRINFET